MTVNDTYGTRVYDSAELAGVLAEHLGLSFAQRESDYRGIYYLAAVSPYRIEIQPNVIPADEGQDDLYDPDHPHARTLLLVTGPHRAPTLDAGLDSINELELLTQEMG